MSAIVREHAGELRRLARATPQALLGDTDDGSDLGTWLCLLPGFVLFGRGAIMLLAQQDGGPLPAIASLLAGVALFLAAWRLSSVRKRALGGYAVALLLGLTLMSTILTEDAVARHDTAMRDAGTAPIMPSPGHVVSLRIAGL